MAELIARMAELVASRRESDVLVAMGLGSCIGVALLDRASPVAVLAHVVLPEARSGTAVPGKFANTAVPELIRQVSALGAATSDLSAVLVGGAQMLPPRPNGSPDIGHRNEQAVRVALAAAGIAVAVAVTGGTSGRTMRIHVGTGVVAWTEAGTVDEAIAYRARTMLGVAA
ncbi:MAG: chemotaxis protein CheD [Gaiellales bacterium]